MVSSIRVAGPLLALLVASATAFADSRQFELRIDGLACPFCAYGIEKQLTRIEGVTDVRIDIASGKVRLTTKEDADLNAATARAAVEAAGFTLRSFKAEHP